MKYSKALRLVRTMKGLSQKGLADLTNLDQGYISHIEQGKKIPSVEALEKIVKSLGIPLYLFFLLASEKDELKGLSESEAAQLGNRLLKLLLETPKR